MLFRSVDRTVFLTETERAIAIQRTIKNKTGVLDNGKFKWPQAVQALKDPQMWCLVLNSLTSNLCNGGITTVGVNTTNINHQKKKPSNYCYSSHRSLQRDSDLQISKRC